MKTASDRDQQRRSVEILRDLGSVEGKDSRVPPSLSDTDAHNWSTPAATGSDKLERFVSMSRIQQAGEISASLMLVEYVFPTRRRRVSLAASDGELPAELSASPPGLRDAAQSALEMG